MTASDTSATQTIGGESRIYVAIALITLTIPFLIGAAALHGLHDHIQTFHGSDEELFHYPIILQFAESFPKMKIWTYDSAATPLFEIIFAIIAKFISPALPFLRAINVGITYLAAVVLFVVFSKELKAEFWTSLLAALALILSPYVFGISFLLLTDNLALLFATSAIYFALRYRDGGRWNLVAIAAVFATCAILTRQIYVWLLFVLLTVQLLRTRNAPAEPTSGVLALLALALVPLIILFIAWGGANPPRYHACPQFGLQPLTFFTACIGAYGAPFLAVRALESRAAPLRAIVSAFLFLLIAGVLLWFAPLTYVASTSSSFSATCHLMPTDGYLWRASLLFPTIDQTSVLFAILVPLGLGTIWQSWCDEGFRSLAVILYFSYGLIALNNPVLYEKYFDFLALLVCCLTFYSMRSTVAIRSILLIYCVCFIAYVVGNPF